MKLIILLGAIAVLFAGCDRSAIDPAIISYITKKNQAKALGREYLESGTNAYSRVWRSFNDIFPYHSEVFGLTFDKTTKSWETVYGKSGLWWDRYVITLSIPISISSNLSSLREKPIKVQITQLKRVNKLADDRLSFDFTGPMLELNLKEWEEVSTNPIALSEFGLVPITNQPVPMAHKLLESDGASPR